MPAKSKSQQRFFGMIHAYKNGKLDGAPESVRKAAKHISDDDARDFARTSHKGLPERKKKMKKRAGFTDFELGFLTKCAEYGMNAESAYELLKEAVWPMESGLTEDQIRKQLAWEKWQADHWGSYDPMIDWRGMFEKEWEKAEAARKGMEELHARTPWRPQKPVVYTPKRTYAPPAKTTRQPVEATRPSVVEAPPAATKPRSGFFFGPDPVVREKPTYMRSSAGAAAPKPPAVKPPQRYGFFSDMPPRVVKPGFWAKLRTVWPSILRRAAL